MDPLPLCVMPPLPEILFCEVDALPPMVKVALPSEIVPPSLEASSPTDPTVVLTLFRSRLAPVPTRMA